jgi:hypothetical protein
MVTVRGKVPQVLGGMLIPGRRNLFLVGAFQARYGIGPLIRPAALLLARWVRLQDDLPVPIADVLAKIGAKPPRTHLIDPHAAMAQMRRAPLWESVIRWVGARMPMRDLDHSSPAKSM